MGDISSMLLVYPRAHIGGPSSEIYTMESPVLVRLSLWMLSPLKVTPSSRNTVILLVSKNPLLYTYQGSFFQHCQIPSFSDRCRFQKLRHMGSSQRQHTVCQNKGLYEVIENIQQSSTSMTMDRQLLTRHI